MEGGFQVVDVRSPAEFADGHMPGALNFPLTRTTPREPTWVSPTSRRAPPGPVWWPWSWSVPGLPEYLGDLA